MNKLKQVTFDYTSAGGTVRRECYTDGEQDEGASVLSLSCWVEGNMLIVRRIFEKGSIVDEWPARLIVSHISKVYR